MNKNWIRSCDFLNIPTSLSYKNEYFYATNVGATLTIFFIIIIISLSTYEVILLYQKTSFSLISNQYTDLSQTLDFSQTPFLFQIINNRGKHIDLENKILTVEAYSMEQIIRKYENGTQKKKITNTKIELEKCDKLYSNQSEFSELNLSKFTCIKPGQNLTAYGLLGDLNNAFKGIRIYINKCSGSNCYDDNEITKQLHNSKFVFYYSSLSSNMFYLNSKDIKYQLYTKFCSLSTGILKKIVFTYDIGRFYLYNNILFKNKVEFNYILGNDYTIDVDLDPTSTIKNNEYTIAYISFHYSGNIVETRKEVQTLFESLSMIGNIFNIILTIFKVINNYYANKVLFVDIFRTVFFSKENLNLNIKENINFNNCLNDNKKNSIHKRRNLDKSDELSLNNNSIKIKSIKSLNNKIIPSTDNDVRPKKKSKTYSENKGIITKTKLLYYYLLPLWVIRRNKSFNSIYTIKDRICEYFSIEKINELIKFKETLEDKYIKSKMNNAEVININNKNLIENHLNDINNQIIK